MQQNIESKLQEMYGNYQKLDNCNYYVRLDNGNELYIPTSMDTSESLLAYAPGASDSRTSVKNLRVICKGQNAPDYVVVISENSYDRGNILELGTNTINNLGGQVDKAVYASFSAGGVIGITRGNEYLQNHPDTSLSIISCDGCGTYETLGDKYQAIKESKTPFLMITGGINYTERYNKMYNSGYNVYYLKIDNNSRAAHTQLNKNMIDNLLLYTLGESDEIPANNCDYKLYKGALNNTIDFSNIRCDGAGTIIGYDKNKYKSALTFSALSFSNLDKYQNGETIGDGYVKPNYFKDLSLNRIKELFFKGGTN